MKGWLRVLRFNPDSIDESYFWANKDFFIERPKSIYFYFFYFFIFCLYLHHFFLCEKKGKRKKAKKKKIGLLLCVWPYIYYEYTEKVAKDGNDANSREPSLAEENEDINVNANVNANAKHNEIAMVNLHKNSENIKNTNDGEHFGVEGTPQPN